MRKTTKWMLAAAAAMTLWTSAVCAAAKPVDQAALAEAGAGLSSGDAARLEQKLLTSPADLNSRIKLIGYYYNKNYNPIVAGARERHVLWIIQNKPEAPIAGTQFTQLDPSLDGQVFEKARSLWQKQVKSRPKNPDVLFNAAQFFISADDYSTWESLLQRGAALEPKSLRWPDELSRRYQERMINSIGDDRRKAAAKALVQLEKRLKLTAGEEAKFVLKPALATAALESGDIAKASAYAKDSFAGADKFAKNASRGDAIYNANMVLGRIALRSGDVQKAKDCLLEAGKTQVSPAIMFLGPSMILAKGLLDKGEKDTVLKYLDLCSETWSTSQTRINGWKKDIKDGKAPNFGENLQF